MAQCPVCKKKTKTDWRPFCSKRCADIDLGRWMTGAYAVAAEETGDEEDVPRIDPLPH